MVGALLGRFDEVQSVTRSATVRSAQRSATALGVALGDYVLGDALGDCVATATVLKNSGERGSRL